MDLLNWNTLSKHLNQGIPFVLDMGGSKAARIAFTPGASRLSLRLPLTEIVDLPPSAYNEIELKQSVDKKSPVLEISVVSPDLYFAFLQLAGLVVTRFEEQHENAIKAFAWAEKRWCDLTLHKSLMSDEQQLGLFGELSLLAALVAREGATVVESWTAYSGSSPGRHDFRISSADIEVKATRKRLREHTIHGATQMMPSAGSPLYVLSLKYDAAGLGSGVCLCDLIARIRQSLSSSPARRLEFEARIKAAGFRDEDSAHYSQRLVQADPPRLIPVDENFPAITQDDLLKIFPGPVAARFRDVDYTVNLEGMGFSPGENNFKSILGDIEIG